MGKSGYIIKLMMVLVLMGIGGKGWGQVPGPGDFQPKNAVGNWSDFNSWNIRNLTNTAWVAATSGQLPTLITSVYQKAATTITVDNVNAECKDLIFNTSTSSKIAFNAGSILTLYGNLDFGQTTSNIFSTWGVGAKLICAGNAAQSFSTNLNPVHKFIFLEVNKSASGLSFPTQNASFENITLTSGSVIMNSGDLRGSLTATINVNGGTWTQITGANRINGGSGGTDLFALNINGGNMTLATTSGGMAGYNLGSLNITNGGILNLNNFNGNIDVTNTFSIDGTSRLNTAMTTTPSASNNNFLGTVNYNHSTTQNILNTSYGNLILSGGGNKNTITNINVTGNISIQGTAVLPLTTLTAIIGGNWTNYGTAGLTEATSTINFNGAGAQTINTTAGEDFFKLNKSGTGTLTLNSDVRFANTSSELNISNGIIDAGTNTLSGSLSSALTMSAGTLRLGKLNANLPEFSITTGYSLTGGTIELNGAGAQILRGSRVYRGLTFSNSGTKTLTSAPTSVTGVITVSNLAVLDVTGNSIGGTGTDLTMTGASKYITDGASTKPDALGNYTLANTSTIVFSNNAGTQQNIRLTPNIGIVNYGNVDVSGSNVGLSGPTSVLNMQTGSTFKVAGSGTFNVQNTNGFTGTSTTAINNSNSPTISLIAGSTINYDGLNQTITNTVAYQNLKLSGIGLKTAPATNLLIEGNLIRSATSSFNANSGRVVFQGLAAQNFTDATGLAPIEFYNATNTNTTNLIINNTLAIQNELNLTPTAKLNLNTGDIILRSTAIRSAHITDLGTTIPSANITYGFTGLFNIERYLQSIKSWRLLSTPIMQDGLSITNSWREAGSTVSTGYGTQLTGPSPASTGMDEITGRGSMKWYNKAINNYVEILNTADQIARPQGYYVFVRGDRAQNIAGVGSATNLRMRGRIFTGDQTFATLVSLGATDGFESVGNPYASQINYKTVTKSNLEQSYTVWNPTAGFYGVGRFIQYVSTTGLNGDYINSGNTVNTIESGQAFFIQSAVGVSGNITIKESDKLTGSNLVSRNAVENRTGVTVPTLEVNLHDANITAPLSLLDHVVLNFDSSYGNSFDANDVRKFMNSNDNLAIKIGTRNLIVERRNTLSVNDTIFLSLTNTRIAPYRFEIDPSVLNNLPLAAFLRDKFLQTETPVSLTAVTNVNFSITNDPASRVADRFMIVFSAGASSPLPFSFTSISAKKNTDKTNTVKWNTANEINLSNYSIERSIDGINFTEISNTPATANNGNSAAYSFVDVAPLTRINHYRIKAVLANGQFLYSAFVKVLDNETKSKFAVQPNPVINKTVHISFVNMEGNCNMKLVSKQGATVFTRQITVSSNNEIKNVVVGGVATGVYEIIITNTNGTTLAQTVYLN